MKDILHHKNGFYVTKERHNYHVWVPGITHSTCDSAYKELELAISRCEYLAGL